MAWDSNFSHTMPSRLVALFRNCAQVSHYRPIDALTRIWAVVMSNLHPGSSHHQRGRPNSSPSRFLPAYRNHDTAPPREERGGPVKTKYPRELNTRRWKNM